MRLIAIEEHVLPIAVRDPWAKAPPSHDPVSAAADGGENGQRLADLGAGRLAWMDEQGVDVQVLSLTRRLEIVGPERLLFSTDYPYQYQPGGAPRRFLEEVTLDEAARANFAHGNWERLTGKAG